MDDTHRTTEETVLLQRGIEQLNAGDTSVRGELLNIACRRLLRLTHRIRRDLTDEDLGTTDSSLLTEDVFQQASLRLYQALYDTPIKDARHFFRLAAVQIRRELTELCRRCEQLNHDSREQMSLEEWSHWALFHDSVDALPDREREIFELIWYHEMTRSQASELLGVPMAEIRRRWRSARLSLYEMLCEDGLPTKSPSD